MKENTYLIPYTKMNSNGLSLRPETIKLLEENIGEELLDVGLGSNFFGYDSKNISNKGKSKHLGTYQSEKLYSTGKSQPDEKAPIKWKKIFANHISGKEIISTVYKKLIQLNSKSTGSFIFKMDKFSQRRHTDSQQVYEKCSTSSIIREMQTEATMIYHITPVRMSFLRKTEVNKCWSMCRKGHSSRYLGYPRLRG